MDKLSERWTEALDPDWQSGRDDSAGANDTFSRPPTDLRGNPAALVRAPIES